MCPFPQTHNADAETEDLNCACISECYFWLMCIASVLQPTRGIFVKAIGE